MGKVIPFVVFKGRHDKELFYTSEVASEKAPLTSFNLFRAAAVSGPLQSESRKEITTVLWRKLGKALDVIEAGEKAEAKSITLEDDWYDLMRPTLDRIIAVVYRENSPVIEDTLNAAISAANVNGAKPTAKPAGKK